MENKKDNSFIVVLLVILVIGLGVLCTLFATNTIELSMFNKENKTPATEPNSENTNNETNTVVEPINLVGTYEYRDDEFTASDGSTDWNKHALLQLNEDGTYVYVITHFMTGFSDIKLLYYGNYIVNDNNLILNNLFTDSQPSDPRIEYKHFTINLSIDENQRIIDINETTVRDYLELGMREVTLEKVSDPSKIYDIYSSIDNQEVRTTFSPKGR